MISGKTTTGPPDTDKLRQILHDERIRPDEETAFRSMLDTLESGRYSSLTEKQRAWVDGVRARLELDAGDAENLYSSGLVPTGRPVETPDVLRKLPMRPPGKR